MNKSLLTLVATLALVSASARGQANLTFSGGNGSPFSLTLTQPIVFTITSTVTFAGGPGFLFQNVGINLNNGFPPVTGTITFSIDGGPPRAINTINSGFTGGSINANDLYMFGFMTGVNVGSVIQLNPGTLTTSGNVSAALPPNGSFNSFVLDSNGNRASPNGIAVPEPGPTTLFVAGALGILVVALRKHHRT